MNPLAELTASFTGWAAIIAGRPDAASHFRTDATGVAFAAMTFLVAVLLSVAAQSAAVGMPSAGQLLFGLIAQGLTTVLLGLAMAWALKFLRLDVPLRTLLVPVLYAMAYVFVLAIPLTLIGPNLALLAIFGLAWLIFRAARVLAGMKFGLALAFAGLCVIVLVVVPNALYMLLLIAPA